MRRLSPILAWALVLVSLPIAASADSIVAAYLVGEEPAGIVVDPGDGRIYVANSKNVPGPGSISVVNPQTGSVKQLTTSGPADFLALDATHRRLYSSNADRTVQVFDLNTMFDVAILPVGGLGIAVDEASRRVYVVDFAAGASYLAVIDGATNTVVQSVQAPASQKWWGLAHDAALHRLFVTNIDYQPSPGQTAYPGLIVLDDRDLSLVAEVSLPVITRLAIAVDDARHLVYVAGADPAPTSSAFAGSMFYVVDGTSLAIVDATSVPGYPGGIAIAPASHRIFLTNHCNGCDPGYRVLDDMSFDVIDTASTYPYSPLLPLVHPDGRLYFGAWTPGQDVLAAVFLGNTAPVVRASAFAPRVPTTNDTVKFDVDAVDGDLPALNSIVRDPLTSAYEWSRNGVVITGETGPSLDLSRPGIGDRGDTIATRATFTDPEGLSTSVTASVVIANAAPATAVTLSDTSPGTDDVLTATALAPDADGDPVAVTYEWTRNGVVIATETTQSLDLATHANRGDVITVRVTASDDHGGVGTASASGQVANSPPSVSVSLSNTSPTSDLSIAAQAVASDPDGDAVQYSFIWKVNGVVVATTPRGPNASASFDLSPLGHGDRGDTVVVEVVAWDVADGNALATASALVVNAAPGVNIGFSDETPSSRDVVTAFAIAGDADGDTLTFSYVWSVDGVVKRAVTGTTATSDSLDLGARGVARQGDTVVCEVTVSDGVATGSWSGYVTVTNNKH